MIAQLVLFVALGLDTFAVAVGLGIKGLPRSRWFRIGVTFALFEGLMPAVGLLIGRTLVGRVGSAASYAAGLILLGLGLWEIRESLADDDVGETADADASLRRSTWLLGLSVSLDELAVGFSIGVVGASVGIALFYIAAQALVVTFFGLWAGARVGRRLQERAELVAGVLLALLGLAMLIKPF